MSARRYATIFLAAAVLMGVLATGAAAAPAGSFTLTAVECQPHVTGDIRVSLLATGSKQNILTVSWSDTGQGIQQSLLIPQSDFANLQSSDFYTFDWTPSVRIIPLPAPGVYTMTGTATLQWLDGNGNTKQIAMASESVTCIAS
jgi:hypothetical protein